MSVTERLEELIQSTGAIGIAGALIGSGSGAFEAIARRKPIMRTSLVVGLNTALFSSFTYLTRESIRNLRIKSSFSSKYKLPVGSDGMLAGALTGFLACRYFGGHGRYAYIGAVWSALIAGSADFILSHAWQEIDRAQVLSLEEH